MTVLEELRARLAVRLSTYDFTIAWKPGKFHGNAHGVSRIPNETDGEEDPNCLENQTTLALYKVRILKFMSKVCNSKIQSLERR